jgi:hypothetical protein
LSCPVVFTHRGDEWAAQAASGAVRYDLTFEAASGRWYVDASWRLPRIEPPRLEELRARRVLAVDLNADHLACWVLDPSGNPVGTPCTVPMDLAGQPATTRDGRLRAAITAIIRLANENDCRSISIEDLNFTDARQIGRERLGRGRRGRCFRRIIAGIPTHGFRDRLVGMAANQGLWVIAVDPGWTSKWGQRYWRAPLARSSRSSVTVTRHHAAAVVIGRRGLGFGARRRRGVTRAHRWMGNGELPARPDAGPRVVREPDLREATGLRSPPPRRPVWLNGPGSGTQVGQDRSGPPRQDDLLPTSQGR